MSIPSITLEGTPKKMGRQYGEALSHAIHALAEERLRLTLQDLEAAGLDPDRDACLSVAGKMLSLQAEWHPEVHQEFMGIAEGARIDPARLLIGNGFTDFRDVVMQLNGDGLSECTSFAVSPKATADRRTYAGQTWDMHASAEPFVTVVRRRPQDGPQTLALTTAGCLTLIGVNEHGVALGNNNLTPDDARPGVYYLAMLHAALACTTYEEAVQTITSAPRASGHHYYVADDKGSVCGIETTALKHEILSPTSGTYVHANHYRAVDMQSAATAPNSIARESALQRHFDARRGSLRPEDLMEALQDRRGAPDCICRYGNERTTGLVLRRQPGRTCAAVVLDPERRGFWATWGPPDHGIWEWYGLSEGAAAEVRPAG